VKPLASKTCLTITKRNTLSSLIIHWISLKMLLKTFIWLLITVSSLIMKTININWQTVISLILINTHQGLPKLLLCLMSRRIRQLLQNKKRGNQRIQLLITYLHKIIKELRLPSIMRLTHPEMLKQKTKWSWLKLMLSKYQKLQLIIIAAIV
jgi:hypothetical protein